MFFPGICLILIVCILGIKSDTAHLPSHRKVLDPLAELMQNNQYRDEFIALLTAQDEQTTREINLINEYCNLIRDRTGFIKQIQNQLVREQMTLQQLSRNTFENNHIEQAVRTVVELVYEQNVREPLTLEQRRQYRQAILKHLEMLYDFQERVIIRYQLEMILKNLNANKQHEQQQRLLEQPTQDQGLKMQRAIEQNAYDKLEANIRGRIQNFQNRLTQEQLMLFQHVPDVRDLINCWIELQKTAVRMELRRAQEREQYMQQQQQQQQAMKRRAQENIVYTADGKNDKRKRQK